MLPLGASCHLYMSLYRQLYDLLSHPAVAKRKLPVLLACNKADQGTKAHTVEFVRKRLEKEIDQVRSIAGWHQAARLL